LRVIPVWEGDKAPLKKGFEGDFKGKNGETLLLYEEERVLLLGLGKKATEESVRRAYAAAVRAARAKKFKSVNFVSPGKFEKGFVEGVLLTNYAFTEYKKDEVIEHISFIGLKDQKLLQKLETIRDGIFWVRNLVNRNSDDKAPAQIAKLVQELGKGKLKAKILDKHKLHEEGMGLILAVNRASSHDPYLVQLSYHGNPKSKDHVVLVGKGVTYDTGGLSLKPTDGMLTMKCDMAGAATVLGAVKTAAELGLKVNVTALAPLTENCIDGKSYKPGDVYKAYNGKTVEITNTDAEGRLILADALSYAAKHLKPTCMIDLATLTGAIVIAIGEEMSGLFTKDEKLAKQLLKASDETDELLWRMPINEDYKEAMKSEIADLVNSGGRDAGAIKATLFLQEFTGDTPWAHIDIAGPAYLTKPKHYNTTHATGYGIRLLMEFLENR